MRTVWSGPMLLAAVLGLAGQGALLVVMGAAPVPLAGSLSVLFLLTIIFLALCMAWPGRRSSPVSVGPARWLNLRSLLVVLALALQGGMLLVRMSAPPGAVDSKAGPEEGVVKALDQAETSLDSLLEQLGRMEGTLPGQLAANPGQNTNLYDRVASARAAWEAGPGVGFPLELVVWSGDERIAWTAGAEPFAAVPDSLGDLRLLAQGREGWTLRDLVAGHAGQTVEMQVRLTATALHFVEPKVTLSVVNAARAAQLERIHHGQGRRLDLVGRDGEPLVWIQAESGQAKDVVIRQQGLAFFLLVLGWLLLLGIVVYEMPHGKPGGLLPALVIVWLARALLARLDIFSRLVGIFPDVGYPASPASWFSLLDPAYFATPVFGGWLASTADALLTGILLLGTLAVLWKVAVFGRPDRQRPAWRPGMGGGPVLAFFFGLSAALGLLGMAWVTDLVAANANARLIGTGVPLTSLSFWALHLVLMMGSISLVLLLGLLMQASSVAGNADRKWSVAALAAAPVAGLLVTWFATSLTLQQRILAVVLVLLFWLGIPALADNQRLLRRLGLPVLLLLVVIWNHDVLRNLDNRVERNWLENKAEAITMVDTGWTRFLLGSILGDMREGESRLGKKEAATDIWRDEPAWQLWQDSALEDLGGACLVELLDANGQVESLITRGFLRDFTYEVSRRSLLSDREGVSPPAAGVMTFQTELRRYSGGDELVMIGEVPRTGGGGWLRVEIPLRSWRIATLQRRLNPIATPSDDDYQPRVDVGRPILLVRGDDKGWQQATNNTFPDQGSQAVVDALKSGRVRWREVKAGNHRWVCLWQPLPPGAARSPGEGFLIGLQVPDGSWVLLDLSRLMLLNLVFLFLGQGLLAWGGWLSRGRRSVAGGKSWRPGFQERFLGGYLLLGLFLLLVVGMSVDRVGYEAVRNEARAQTRQGLSLAVEQLRSLLVEQAQSLAGSDYIADLLLGQLSGHRPAGPTEFRQAMVFDGDGALLLDETLSNLSAPQARVLLAAGRSAPLVVIANGPDLYVGTVIPIDLTDILNEATGDAAEHAGRIATDGFFLYRQKLDADLLVGLASLVRGEATLILKGQPVLASHPEEFFSGRKGQLAAPGMMADLQSHPSSSGIFASADRPFAFTGAMPLPAFSRSGTDNWRRDLLPAVLALSFPDREREFGAQRTGNVLFLTGLANLILLTALALAGILAWNIFRPLRVLADATRSLAAGDYQAPLPEPGHDEVGKLAEAFGTMRFELHTARERLASREQFLATVLDRVPVGVGVLDAEGNLVVLNPPGRMILAAFAPGSEVAPALKRLRESLVDEAAANGRGEIHGVGGSRTVRGAVAPLDLPGGRTDTMVVFEDITDFLANKKLALSAELTRQVAHEIKNPLTPIQLSAQLLGQAWRDQHDELDRIVPETVARILDQVGLLRRIATEFSLLGRPDQLVVAPVDLPSLVRRVAADYGSGYNPDQAGEVHPPSVTVTSAAVPPVLANADSLQKILGNLMQNSLDAAGEGQALELEVTWRWDTDTVTLVWRDHGTGIPHDVAEHLFDPYFSTKTRGTGLGLAICHNLVDRMGGVMTLENHPSGPGAVATLTLPRAKGGVAEEEDEGA